jgi:hypothetical protein
MNDDIPAAPELKREETSLFRVCTTCPNVLDNDQPEYCIQCHECYNDLTTKRECTICHQQNIVKTEPAWKKICGKCFKNAERRQCCNCKENTILDFEPAWRTLCSACFSNKELYRACCKCGAKDIKPGTSSYITKCGKCWLEQRALTHVQCPKCKDSRLKMKRGQKMCRDCYVTTLRRSK